VTRRAPGSEVMIAVGLGRLILGWAAGDRTRPGLG